MERFFEPVPFGPQMGSCLPLLCRVGGYPQELHFPDSFALGLLISSVKGRLWQEIAGWGLWRGPDISVLLFSALGCVSGSGAFPGSQLPPGNPHSVGPAES